MTRVDFYIEEKPRPGGHRVLACRVAEKAYRLGHRVFIHTGRADLAVEMDQLLWTFRDRSFVPHARAEAVEGEPPPVIIAHDVEPQGRCDLLINLDREVPTFFSRFERVADLVGEDEESRAAGRERYRFYRDRGYPLNTHRL